MTRGQRTERKGERGRGKRSRMYEIGLSTGRARSETTSKKVTSEARERTC